MYRSVCKQPGVGERLKDTVMFGKIIAMDSCVPYGVCASKRWGKIKRSDVGMIRSNGRCNVLCTLLAIGERFKDPSVGDDSSNGDRRVYGASVSNCRERFKRIPALLR